MQSQKRQTAYKLWIKDLTNGNYIRDNELPSYIQLNDKNISRVNLIANVVYKFKSEDNNYAYLTIDDSTSTIRLKVWREDTRLLENIDIGNIVLVIGKLRFFNEEIFINPEIVKKLNDPNWELVRKIELLKEYGKPIQEKVKISYNEDVEEKISITESSRQRILNIIERFSTEDGIRIERVISESGLNEEDAENIINDLLMEGEIYEPRPSWIRTL